MPVYLYKCLQCNELHSDIRQSRARNRAIKCECGGLAKRAISMEIPGDIELNYRHPVLSDAMGVSPGQVQEHRRRFPDIPITDDGRVICESHNKRKRILKELDFVDKDSFI